ncbi:GumC family protein [Aureimonas sp. AU4]|uniref:GumC family protein n=1 Tax=Aureimonas sp. AU4 TaxID=1638163 RepID=UPI0007864D9D|nr:GumC family protein [Aureimonas sp. AU4]
MFYESHSPAQPAVVAPAGGRMPGGLFDPVALFSSVWRARWLIVLFALAGAGLALASAMSTPKQFTAVSRLVLDPRDLNIVQNDVTVTPQGLSTDATLALVESQIAVMTSDRVLGRVISEATLTADSEFNGTRTSLLGGFSAALSVFGSQDGEAMVRDRELVTLAEFRKHVAAARNPNSFVIDLAVRSEDAEKAARLANLVTETFIAEQGRAQAEIARRATQALSSRLAELRQRVVDTEEAVETYKAENRLVGVGGKLIDDEYITRINNQLADVRAQITALNVRAESLRRASVDDVVEGSFPEGLNSESLQRLRQTYAEAAQNEALLASRLGPRHPQRIASEGALASARRAIQTELSRIVASAQTELARAQATERDLTAQIDTLRSRQIETSGSFVRLRELEREVDASRAVYEAYLLRARQTSEQESLNTTNVRVISDASVPLLPSSLSRKVVVAAGGIAGAGLGVAIVLLAAIVRALRGHRAPAEAPSFAMGEAAAAQLARDVLSHDRAETVAEHGPAGASEPAETRPAPVGAGWELRGTSAAEPSDAIGRDLPSPSTDASADLAAHPHEEETAEADEDGASREHAVDDGPSEDELERRRDALRERIRALGAARRAQADKAPEGEGTADQPDAGPSAPEGARERVSLRLAALRRRRLEGAGS